MSRNTSGRKPGNKNQRITKNSKKRKQKEMQLFQNEKSQRKVLLQEKKGGNRICKNFTEEIIYDKLFFATTSNQQHDRETFIADSGATSHVVKSE